MKKITIQKVFIVLSAFCFDVGRFSSPGCCISFTLHLLHLVLGIQSMIEFYLTGVHLKFLEGRSLKTPEKLKYTIIYFLILFWPRNKSL